MQLDPRDRPHMQAYGAMLAMFRKGNLDGCAVKWNRGTLKITNQRRRKQMCSYGLPTREKKTKEGRKRDGFVQALENSSKSLQGVGEERLNQLFIVDMQTISINRSGGLKRGGTTWGSIGGENERLGGQYPRPGTLSSAKSNGCCEGGKKRCSIKSEYVNGAP